MAVRTQAGQLANARTTTGRDSADLREIPSTITLFVYITGGTATVDIEVADSPSATPIPLKSLTTSAVVVLGVPASKISTNVTAIAGATVNTSYRNYVGGEPPAAPVSVFTGSDIVASSITVSGSLTTNSPVATRFYGPAQPGTSNGTLFTASGKQKVKLIHAINTTGSAATLSLAVNGTAATAANCFIKAFSVPANSTYDWTGELTLANNDTVQGLQGTGSAITVIISGEATN